jgi:hypothetical protein
VNIVKSCTIICRGAYRAFMRFFTGMPSHMNHQHILSLEGLLLSRAFLPSTNEDLLVGMNVIGIDVLDEFFLGAELKGASGPVAISLDEVIRLVLVPFVIPVGVASCGGCRFSADLGFSGLMVTMVVVT